MMYKDEYEVARLYSDDDFQRKLAAQLAGDYKLRLLTVNQSHNTFAKARVRTVAVVPQQGCGVCGNGA